MSPICVSRPCKTPSNPQTAQGTCSTFSPLIRRRTWQAQPGSRKATYKQGLLLYHPILLSSPWQAPDDIDNQIKALLAANEPVLLARSLKEDGHTTYDKDNALKQLDVLTVSIKSTLQRVYALTSHSFHVLLRDLILRARQDKNHLFTHIKSARTDHIINLRAHTAGKRNDALSPLTGEQLKPHSATHTLQFIENEYVEKDDDASCRNICRYRLRVTWDEILPVLIVPSPVNS